MFLIAALLVFPSQDLLLNYGSPQAFYNSGMLNHGSWFCHIPGWSAPNGCRMAEPVLFSWTWYSWGFLGAAIVGCSVLRWIKARNPTLGPVGLIAIAFGITIVADVAIEFAYLLGGIYVYGGSIKGATILAGHYYQFPLYEAIFWPLVWTSLICIRYFRDDKGQSMFERGLDRVHVGTRTKALFTMLALLAAMDCVAFGFYNLPYAVFSVFRPASWPEDIQKRSYFTNGVCGPRTQFACPSPQLPVDRQGTILHIDPEGRVIQTSSPTPPLVSDFAHTACVWRIWICQAPG
jgi:hypothetical protein